MTFMC